MECYSEQTCAIFVDGELAVEEARHLRDHLVTCQRCRNLVDALRAENRVVSESLRGLPDEAAGHEFFRFRLSKVWGDLAVMVAVLALGSLVFVFIDELNIPEALEWFNPFSLSGLTNLMFNLSDYFAHGGTVMLTEYAAAVGGLFLLLLLGGGVLLMGRRGRLRQPSLRLLIVLLTLSLPTFALERRHGEFVTVPASETVDDTLLATGNTVRVEGVINGDLLVLSRDVEVRGTVKGDLVSLAKRTVVSGNVEGHIYNFSQSLDLDGQVGHSVYAWSQSFLVGNGGHVGGGVVVGAGDFVLDGEVKRSVTIFASNADVSGTVVRELTMAGGSLTLTNTARVGGNLTARVRELKNVRIADSATITGKRDIQVHVRKNPYTRPRFYFHQAIWLASALLVGWLGLLLFPGFFQSATQRVGLVWRSLALGVAVLAGVPVAVVVAAITLVGLPLSLILFAAYLVAIYLAKIWVAAFLGRMLLKPSGATKGDWVLGLLLGLLILAIIGFIPYFGGLVRFGVVCLGLGAFAWQLYQSSRRTIMT
jgi:cytoskeletal protein CcmA (bactofilin family)